MAGAHVGAQRTGLRRWSSRAAAPPRLMAGLQLVKHVKGLSDEEVCAQFVENLYVQFFCGETHFQTRLPVDRSSMTRWRQRIGPERLEVLLAETLSAAERGNALKKATLERVTVDTAVETKAVAHPTDSRLIKRGIEWLIRACCYGGGGGTSALIIDVD